MNIYVQDVTTIDEGVYAWYNYHNLFLNDKSCPHPSRVLVPNTPTPLSMQHTRRRSHQDARFFLDGRKVQRDSITSRLSANTSHLPKELCISIAVCVRYLCTWEVVD
jgi:hypothetical protein